MNPRNHTIPKGGLFPRSDHASRLSDHATRIARSGWGELRGHERVHDGKLQQHKSATVHRRLEPLRKYSHSDSTAEISFTAVRTTLSSGTTIFQICDILHLTCVFGGRPPRLESCVLQIMQSHPEGNVLRCRRHETMQRNSRMASYLHSQHSGPLKQSLRLF